MSGSARLFDSSGHLLPPDESNIKLLKSLTKNRAKSPSRRSPARNGWAGNEPKLPDFVQEITQNNESSSGQLASPTALKVEYFNVEKTSLSTEGSPKDGKHLTRKHLDNNSTNNCKPSGLSSTKAKAKMEGGIVNEGALALELMEKPVLSWTCEDVCLWLDDIGLSKFKEQFLSHKVNGRTLLNLSYETLEELGISGSGEDREHFLSAVYNLQEETEHIDDEEEQMMNKEIEETLRDAKSQGNNNEQTHVQLPPVTGSGPTPTDSFASSSRTGSDIGSTPTSEMVEDVNGKIKQESPKKTGAQNKSEPVSPTKAKGKKESSKPTSKKTKPKGKRISRLLSSIHGTHKDPSLLHTAPPIYKNAFHNLMNTGPQGVIKVWTEMFLTDMQYVSLLVKHDDSAFEVIKMVLEKSNAKEDPECYRICELNERGDEYILDRHECPLQRERKWSDPDNCRFELRWRNERLIEWRNSLAQQSSKQTISEEPGHEVQEDRTSSPPSSMSTSDADSPGSNDATNNDVMETEFAYVVEVDREKKSNTEAEKTEKNNGVVPHNSHNYFNVNDDDPDSIQSASKRLVSSCPDLSQKDMIDGDQDEGPNLLISKNFDFLNAENDLTVIGNGPTTNLDSSTEDLEASTNVGEFEYSQQLRKSSKRLSDRLRLQGKARIEGKAVEIGVDASNQDGVSTVGDSIDGKGLGMEGDVEGSIDVPPDSKVGVNGAMHVSKATDEAEVGDSGIETALIGTEDETAPKETGSEASAFVMPPKVSEVFEKNKGLQNENTLLVEENRELKKKCRTFEGKSRLKERELEEMEAEKNELTDQVQEMATELHSLRAANTELRAEVDEANTKLSDVDGWVTRDVFEDIRGQLSLSAEECDKKDEEIEEIQRKCKTLEVENKKMHELEVEVQKLNERIEEGKKELVEVKKDLKGKEKEILELELENQKMENSLQEMEKEKQEKEKQVLDVETEMEVLKNNHAVEKKDLQKRVSDREYEILIMKEEKKELCVKMQSFEGNVETLREEMKNKDAEHEATIAEMEKQSMIKDESLSVMVSNLEELVNERDLRIKELKKQIALSGAPKTELQAKEHAYEQNKVYLKHLIALVKEKDPSILEALNKTLSSRDSEDWC